MKVLDSRTPRRAPWREGRASPRARPLRAIGSLDSAEIVEQIANSMRDVCPRLRIAAKLTHSIWGVERSRMNKTQGFENTALWTRSLALMLFALSLLVFPERAQAKSKSRAIRIPLTIHVATDRGRSVVSETKILASVRHANRELATFDVYLVVDKIVPMRGGTRIETPDQRFALAKRAPSDGTVHVFFVDHVELTSPRKGDHRVSGMHWRYHGLSSNIHGREYLAVAHNAPTTTLVHEVGHAFGLAHDSDRDNLMCSCRRNLDPAFTKDQGRRLRNGARRYLKRKRKP